VHAREFHSEAPAIYSTIKSYTSISMNYDLRISFRVRFFIVFFTVFHGIDICLQFYCLNAYQIHLVQYTANLSVSSFPKFQHCHHMLDLEISKYYHKNGILVNDQRPFLED